MTHFGEALGLMLGKHVQRRRLGGGLLVLVTALAARGRSAASVIGDDSKAPVFGDLRAARGAVVRDGVASLTVNGHGGEGDGGGGRYVAARPGAGPGKFQSADGQWWALAAEKVTFRHFGATGDGETNDTVAVAAANAYAALTGARLVATRGRYGLAAGVVFTVRLHHDEHAVLKLEAGVTVTYAAGVEAGVHQIFDLTGSSAIVINPAFTSTGYPEWWGARTGNGDFDCQPALAACIVACRVTQLQDADYFMNQTLVIDTPNRTVMGSGMDWNGPHHPGTRIIINKPALDGVFIGTRSSPGLINDFLQHVRLEKLCVWRNGGPTPPPTGFGGPTGIKMQYCLNCRLQEVGSHEHSTAFSYQGVVYTKTMYCQAARSVAGTSPANDFFVGFYVDEGGAIGAAAGDASLYFDSSSVNGTTVTTLVYGWYFPRGFTDVFIRSCETTQTDDSIRAISDPANESSSQDFHIVNNIFDGCTKNGIYIQGAPSSAGCVVNIMGNYVAAAGQPFGAGIRLHLANGTISVTNNMVLGDAGASSGCGLLVDGCNGVTSQGNMYSDCFSPIVVQNASNVNVSDIVNNFRSSPSPGVTIKATTRSKFACVVRGRAATLSSAVNLDSTSRYNEVNCSGLDPHAISGGSANKLVYDGRQITAAGVFGTGNLASGIMA